MPNELNPNYSIFGGQLIAWLDKDLYIFTTGITKYKKMVTASMERAKFKNPAFLGEIIEIYGAIKKIRHSSVTAVGRAIAVDPNTEKHRVIIECEMTFVAIDDHGKPLRLFEHPSEV